MMSFMYRFPLQRSKTSKTEVRSDENMMDLPAIEPLNRKGKVMFRIPQKVFTTIDMDGESPRSVLCDAGSGCLQVRSPRSPRLGLSSTRLCDSQCRDGVGLAIVAALTVSDEACTENRDVEASKTLTETVNARHSSPKQSEAITIPQFCDSLCNQFENTRYSSRYRYHQEFDMNNFQRYDVEMDTGESIFSTASPASSFNDHGYAFLPETGFLNSCYFCKRQLGPGKDIYMYRGDRGFCSVECRYQHILIDERKERCSVSVPSRKSKHRKRMFYSSGPSAAA